MNWKFVVFSLAALAVVDLSYGGHGRERRSPFKKHKIVVVDDQQQSTETGGWGIPQPQPPPPLPAEETIVEHHHHYYEVPSPNPPPPPPVTHSHSVVIEVNKGKGKLEKEAEKLHEIKEAVDQAFVEIENDKKAKLEGIKEDFEGKLDILAQIPHKIASDIDLIGRKVVEDIERKKKEKEGGISIQIWKGEGGRHRGPPKVSTEEHHHHYYHENAPQPPPPPPTEEIPPRKQYGWGGGEDRLEHHITRFADIGVQFMDQLAGGTQYRVPVQEESGGGWQRPGDKGKGFSLNVWKSKGFRRRR